MDPSILADVWPDTFSTTGAKSVWEDTQRPVSVTSHFEASKGSGLRRRKPDEQSLQPQFVLCLGSPEANKNPSHCELCAVGSPFCPKSFETPLPDCQYPETEHHRHILLDAEGMIALYAWYPKPDSLVADFRSKFAEMASRDRRVDASSLHLSDAQLVAALTDCHEMQSLDVSNQPLITIVAITQILERHHTLKRLVMMNCRGITADDLGQLLQNRPQLFYGIEALAHPSLFHFSLYGGPVVRQTWRPALSFISLHAGFNPMMRGISLPYFTLPGVVQGLIDMLTGLGLGQHNTTPFEMEHGHPTESWGNALAMGLAAAARPEGQSWLTRNVVAIPRPDLRLVEPATGGWVFIMRRTVLPVGCNPYAHIMHHLILRGFEGHGPNGWAFVKFYPGKLEHSESQDSKDNPESTSESASKLPKPLAKEGLKLTFESGIRMVRGRDYPDEHMKAHLEEADLSRMRFESHDLRSFLRHMEAEGRAPAPEAAVKRAEELLQLLSQASPPQGEESSIPSFDGCPFVDGDALKRLVRDANTLRKWTVLKG